MLDRRLGLIALLLLVGCARNRTAQPIEGTPYTDLLEVARELGFETRRDEITQAITLMDGVNRVVVCPGSQVALVNGQAVDLSRPARIHRGRLLIPVEGLPRVTSRLKARPVGRGPRR